METKVTVWSFCTLANFERRRLVWSPASSLPFPPVVEERTCCMPRGQILPTQSSLGIIISSRIEQITSNITRMILEFTFSTTKFQVRFEDSAQSTLTRFENYQKDKTCHFRNIEVESVGFGYTLRTKLIFVYYQ